MLTHRQLRYFVEIVDCGGFSRAAERLFVAQSALSRQVREMESSLGVPLLRRDTRRLEMTAAGRSLHADARRILASMEEAAVNAIHAQRGTAGTLHLLHSSSVPLTAPILALMREHVAQHPGVSIEVSQASSEHQALDIQEGRSDIGLARSPILRRYADLTYTPLYEEALVVATSAHHPLAGRSSVCLADLSEELFVATPHMERGGLSQRVAELCRRRGFQPLSAAVQSRKWAQLSLVQAGFGIAIVPVTMVHLAPAGVCPVPLEDDDCKSTVLGLWRRDASALVERFADMMKTLGEGGPRPLS